MNPEAEYRALEFRVRYGQKPGLGKGLWYGLLLGLAVEAIPLAAYILVTW